MGVPVSVEMWQEGGVGVFSHPKGTGLQVSRSSLNVNPCVVYAFQSGEIQESLPTPAHRCKESDFDLGVGPGIADPSIQLAAQPPAVSSKPPKPQFPHLQKC